MTHGVSGIDWKHTNIRCLKTFFIRWWVAPPTCALGTGRVGALGACIDISGLKPRPSCTSRTFFGGSRMFLSARAAASRTLEVLPPAFCAYALGT